MGDDLIMRLCKGSYTEFVDGKWRLTEFENGAFHQWGINYEEFENGPGMYSTAIVELPNGRIVTPAANNIQFITMR